MFSNYQLCIFNSLHNFFYCWKVASMNNLIADIDSTSTNFFIINIYRDLKIFQQLLSFIIPVCMFKYLLLDDFSCLFFV